jgi:catalase
MNTSSRGQTPRDGATLPDDICRGVRVIIKKPTVDSSVKLQRPVKGDAKPDVAAQHAALQQLEQSKGATSTAAVTTAVVTSDVVDTTDVKLQRKSVGSTEAASTVSSTKGSNHIAEAPITHQAAKYDVHVVGSGPGGGTVAWTIAEMGGHVKLMEGGSGKFADSSKALANHGKASEDPSISQKDKHGRSGQYVDHGKGHVNDPKKDKLDGKTLEPRGAGRAGSHGMNAGIWYGADDGDLRGIAKATGDATWEPENFKKFVQKIENAEYQPLLKLIHKLGTATGIDALQNPGGLGFNEKGIQVNRPGFDLATIRELKNDPQLIKMVAKSFIHTFGESTWKEKLVGVLTLFDPNHNWMQGVNSAILTPLTVTKEGRRSTVGDMIEATQSERPDLIDVQYETKVHSVIISDDKPPRVIGLRYRQPDGSMFEEPATKVVLSGGAYHSPLILQRSGIGDPADLKAAGVEVKHALPGVGKGLKGRYEVGVTVEVPDPIKLVEKLQKLTPEDPLYKVWEKTGKGPLATNGSVFMRREGDNVLFMVVADFQGYEKDYSKKALADPKRVTIVVLNKNTLDPNDAKQLQDGTVKLDPSDPEGQPIVNRKFHDDGKLGGSQQEVQGVIDARRMIAAWGIETKEIWPGSQYTTAEQLAQECAKVDWDHHPQGTCRMGKPEDPMTVVDGDGKVVGIEGLYVADASIVPKDVNIGPFVQRTFYGFGRKIGEGVMNEIEKGEAATGRFSPLGLQMNQTVSAKNTLSDNFRIALHSNSMLHKDGTISEQALKILVETTAKNGFSPQELADANAIVSSLTAQGDKNAPIAAKLARAVAKGVADQGFIKDTWAKLDDLKRSNSLPSLAWKDVDDTSTDKTRWKKEIGELQQLFVEKGKLNQVGRAFHEKQLWGGMADMKVRHDVPEFLRFGPFAEPDKVGQMAVRFSNGQGCPFKDSDPDVRGVALKTFDDKGQPWDMLMTNQESSHARDAEQFMKFAKVSGVMQTEGQIAGAKVATKKILQGSFDASEAGRIALQLAKDTTLHKVQSLTTETYNGGTFQTADGLLCKAVLMPAPGNHDAVPHNVDRSDPNWMQKELEAQRARGPVKMVLGIQVYTGDGKNPDPKDANAVWEGAPVYPVADIEIPAAGRAGVDERKAAEVVNKMAFNPANGFDPAYMTHAREDIYAESAKNRGAISQDEARKAFQELA